MYKKLTTLFFCTLILGSCGWSSQNTESVSPPASSNNSASSTLPTISEQQGEIIESNKSSEEYLEKTQEDLLKLEELLEKKKALQNSPQSSLLNLILPTAHAADEEETTTDDESTEEADEEELTLEEIDALIEALTASIEVNTELALEATENSESAEEAAEDLEAISEIQALVVDALEEAASEDENIAELLEDTQTSLELVDEAVAEVTTAIANGEEAFVPQFETNVQEFINPQGFVRIHHFDEREVAERKHQRAKEHLDQLIKDLEAEGLSQEEIDLQLSEMKKRHEEVQQMMDSGDFENASDYAQKSAQELGMQNQFFQHQKKVFGNKEEQKEKMLKNLEEIQNNPDLSDEEKEGFAEARSQIEAGNIFAGHSMMNESHKNIFKKQSGEFREANKELRQEAFGQMKDVREKMLSGEISEEDAQGLRKEIVQDRFESHKELFSERKESIQNGEFKVDINQFKERGREQLNQFNTQFDSKKNEAREGFREFKETNPEQAAELMDRAGVRKETREAFREEHDLPPPPRRGPPPREEGESSDGFESEEFGIEGTEGEEGFGERREPRRPDGIGEEGDSENSDTRGPGRPNDRGPQGTIDGENSEAGSLGSENRRGPAARGIQGGNEEISNGERPRGPEGNGAQGGENRGPGNRGEDINNNSEGNNRGPRSRGPEGEDGSDTRQPNFQPGTENGIERREERGGEENGERPRPPRGGEDETGSENEAGFRGPQGEGDRESSRGGRGPIDRGSQEGSNSDTVGQPNDSRNSETRREERPPRPSDEFNESGDQESTGTRREERRDDRNEERPEPPRPNDSETGDSLNRGPSGGNEGGPRGGSNTDNREPEGGNDRGPSDRGPSGGNDRNSGGSNIQPGGNSGPSGGGRGPGGGSGPSGPGGGPSGGGPSGGPGGPGGGGPR
jgi:hypothetical protein